MTENNINLEVVAEGECPSIACVKSQEYMVMATVKAPNYVASSRAPLDVICVIDRSGSMQESNKLVLVKRTLLFAVDSFTKDDNMCLISYDDKIAVEFPLLPMTDSNKEVARKAIESLTPGGSTDLCEGLLRGIRELAKGRSRDVASVLLFTDGLANVGNISELSIVQAVRKELGLPISQQNNNNNNNNKNEETEKKDEKKEDEKKTHNHFTVNTFGFGSDHDANMLKKVAETTNGTYYFVDKEESIARSFADCIGGLVSVVGQNILFNIDAATGVTIKKVMSSFTTKIITPGLSYQVIVPDLQSEEKRDILVTVELPATDEPVSVFPVLKASVVYKNVVNKRQDTQQCLFCIDRPVSPSVFPPNIALDKQHNRLLVADALSNANELSKNGQLAQGKEVLNAAIQRVQESVSSQEQFCKGLVDDLKKCLTGLQDANTYRSHGQQYMNTCHSAHGYQRTSHSAWAGQQEYSTSNKVGTRNTYMS